MFTHFSVQPRSAHDSNYTAIDVSWAELITVLRLRKGWTKKDLAEASGVSRTWLWRGLECPPEDARHVEFSDDTRAKIEAALTAEDVEVAA